MLLFIFIIILFKLLILTVLLKYITYFLYLYFIVCDPVMGDNKQMYVPKEILDVYKNEIIHLTDILTPNEYELE